MIRVDESETSLKDEVQNIKDSLALSTFIALNPTKKQEIAKILIDNPNLTAVLLRIELNFQIVIKQLGELPRKISEKLTVINQILNETRFSCNYDEELKKLIAGPCNQITNPYLPGGHARSPHFIFRLLRIGAPESDLKWAKSMLENDEDIVHNKEAKRVLGDYVATRLAESASSSTDEQSPNEPLTIDIATGIIRTCFLATYGFDGYDNVKRRVTTSKGTDEPYQGKFFPWKLALASFLGLPCRPAQLVEDVPQFDFSQLITDLIGGWNNLHLKESIENSFLERFAYSKPVFTSEQPPKITRKKIFQLFILPVKLFVVLPLKIITFPLKMFLNIIKLVTEFIPLTICILLSRKLRDTLNTLSGIRVDYSWGKLTFLTWPLSALAFIGIRIPFTLMFLYFIGRALTSPEKNARAFFEFGYAEGNYPLGLFFGFLGVALTAVLWSMFFSLIVSAIAWGLQAPLELTILNWITSLPMIVAIVDWVSHASLFIAVTAWLSHVPAALSVLMASSTIFMALGFVFNLVFGPIIAILSTLVSAEITTSVFILCGLAAPITTILSRISDELSNEWMRRMGDNPSSQAASIPQLIDRRDEFSAEFDNEEEQPRPSQISQRFANRNAEGSLLASTASQTTEGLLEKAEAENPPATGALEGASDSIVNINTMPQSRTLQ